MITIDIPKKVTLVAVTKKRSIQDIKDIIEHGAQHIAENKVQEAKKKYEILKEFLIKKKIKFHFIGHLQRNKVKHAVEMFDLIQSVDSYPLAQEIDKRAKSQHKIQDILLQVNIGEEEQKYGFRPDEIVQQLVKIKKLQYLKVLGLMSMAPKDKDPRPYFKHMKQLFDQSRLEILSMGMSNDYTIAIQEGANMIRLGRCLFE